jgi:hypothetical protein
VRPSERAFSVNQQVVLARAVIPEQDSWMQMKEVSTPGPPLRPQTRRLWLLQSHFTPPLVLTSRTLRWPGWPGCQHPEARSRHHRVLQSGRPMLAGADERGRTIRSPPAPAGGNWRDRGAGPAGRSSLGADGARARRMGGGVAAHHGLGVAPGAMTGCSITSPRSDRGIRSGLLECDDMLRMIGWRCGGGPAGSFLGRAMG